tara:strand:- start:4642 stop:5202 length:561 start_codon:yes stop_codon:yes gene_type:complete
MPSLRQDYPNSHSFSLVLDGVDIEADDFEDCFFEAGCDDALIAVIKETVILDFDRAAKNLIHAIASAVKDVQSTGARVIRVEPDPLVSVSDIAERIDASRQAVSLWTLGKRGPGKFPAPVVRVNSDTPLWDWTGVARWLYINDKLDDPGMIVKAAIVSYANNAIAYAGSTKPNQFAPLAEFANLQQ